MEAASPHTDDLERLFQAQHHASRRGEPAPWTLRADRLRRLQALVRRDRAAIAQAISADFGQRSRHETELLEVAHVLDGIAHALAHGRRWMRASPRAVGWKFWPGRAALLPQPLGVAGIVAPWNYPLDLSLAPATSALAAGNRAMIKLSELTPRFGALLAERIARDFGEDELCIVNGDAEVARRFCRLAFDHLLFTGSTAVGHAVMRAASENLTPVTLELGGKSPAIIGPDTGSDADFERAVARLIIGKTFNAGQTCIAPDHVYVPRAQQERFLAAARRAVARFYPALPDTPDYTSIISQRHYQRLADLVADATARGAAALPLADAPHDPARRLFLPVALTGVDETSRALREEIFGPVLPVLPYDDIDEAIARINREPRPLALYLFERDRRRIARVLARTVAGGVTVNDTFLHVGPATLPFGGVGASGMGAYHGKAGFDAFSHGKPVFLQRSFHPVSWLYPPYGARAERLLRLISSR